MEAGRNSVIYMRLVPGPNKADNICGKTQVTGTMQRGSTVYNFPFVAKIDYTSRMCPAEVTFVACKIFKNI